MYTTIICLLILGIFACIGSAHAIKENIITDIAQICAILYLIPLIPLAIVIRVVLEIVNLVKKIVDIFKKEPVNS